MKQADAGTATDNCANNLACHKNTDNLLIRIIFNSDAVSTLHTSHLTTSHWQTRLRETTHLRLQACRNALISLKLSAEHLNTLLNIIPADASPSSSYNSNTGSTCAPDNIVPASQYKPLPSPLPPA